VIALQPHDRDRRRRFSLKVPVVLHDCKRKISRTSVDTRKGSELRIQDTPGESYVIMSVSDLDGRCQSKIHDHPYDGLRQYEKK
jgi:hypothetical protein